MTAHASVDVDDSAPVSVFEEQMADEKAKLAREIRDFRKSIKRSAVIKELDDLEARITEHVQSVLEARISEIQARLAKDFKDALVAQANALIERKVVIEIRHPHIPSTPSSPRLLNPSAQAFKPKSCALPLARPALNPGAASLIPSTWA